MMLTRTKAIVRVYMIEGFNFANKDIGGASDPYLVLTCGKKVINERDNYQLDKEDPVFYKAYEFDAEFPGASPLKIQAFDYDDLFGDDLIGETVIDLDDRFFSPEWQSVRFKPVEFRHLHHHSSSGS
jgi:Ca2+-dependent lipid-binding protein